MKAVVLFRNSVSAEAATGGLQLYQKETLTQVFSCEFCEIFKNSFFTEQLRVSENSELGDVSCITRLEASFSNFGKTQKQRLPTNINPQSLTLSQYIHCVKSVQIRSFFYSAFSCIWTEYKKTRAIENSVFGDFPRYDFLHDQRFFLCNFMIISMQYFLCSSLVLSFGILDFSNDLMF